jgi:hypothetical protein
MTTLTPDRETNTQDQPSAMTPYFYLNVELHVKANALMTMLNIPPNPDKSEPKKLLQKHALVIFPVTVLYKAQLTPSSGLWASVLQAAKTRRKGRVRTAVDG